MNDLMMEAAIRFKGVWPENTSYLQVMSDGTVDVYDYTSPRGTPALCSRKEFEKFVKSLFVGAPKDATHFIPNKAAWWYKMERTMLYVHDGEGWQVSLSFVFGGLTGMRLIARPSTSK